MSVHASGGHSPPPHRDPNALRWLGGFALSLLGDQIYFIALGWAATQVAPPSQVGLILAAGSVPRAALLLVGGAAADRFGPKRLLVASDTIRAAVMVIIALALVSGRPSVVLLATLAALFGTVDALFLPAIGALPARLVSADQLARLQGMRGVVQRASLFVGAPLAGWVTAGYGLTAAFGLTAALFAVSVGFLAFLRLRPVDAATAGDAAETPAATGSDRSPPGLLADIGAGLRYAWRDTTLRTLLIVSSASEFGLMGPLNTGLPLLASDRAWGALGLGLMVGGFGVGAAASSLAFAISGRTPRAGQLAGVSVGVIGVCLGLIGLAPTVWWAAAAAVVLGLGGGTVGLLLNSLILLHTADEHIGKVMGLMSLAVFGGIPLTYALTGFVADVAGIDTAFVGGGVLTVAVAAAALSRRDFRRLELGPAAGGDKSATPGRA
jgi:MFS family permease